MSETPREAQEGVAEAVRGLSDNTSALVRHEIAAAQREMLAKAKQALPALGLLGAAAGFGVLSAAATYRLSVRLLEKGLPPATAAFVAAAGYGAAAGAAGVIGLQRLRESQPLFPVETARETAKTVTDAAKAVADTATETAADTTARAASAVRSRTRREASVPGQPGAAS
jgi:hypothetical protein